MADNTIKIGGELESMATGKVVAAASAIKDKSRNKTQEVINGDVEAAIAEQSVLFEALSEETSRGVAFASKSARDAKQYLADLQEAITELPDGQAVSAQVAVNEVDIAGLKSDVVVDLSTRYATSYANLSAALTALNSDTAADATAIKKSGVSIKFINSSTDKYEQWNLKASSWSTNTSDWALDVDGSVTNGKLKLLFELEKPSSNEYVTQASEIGYGDSNVKDRLDKTPSCVSSLTDFTIEDENGNVLLECKNGHLKVKFFDSANIISRLNATANCLSSEDDLTIEDNNGKILVKFSDGHVETKNFNSKDVDDIKDVLNNYLTSILSDIDLTLEDSNDNILAAFLKGEILTKNFNSKEVREESHEAFLRTQELNRDATDRMIVPSNLPNINNSFAAIIKHWGFVGDSLASGTLEYTSDVLDPDTGTSNIIEYDYSWGQMMMSIIGAEGYNFSRGGQTAKYWINEAPTAPAERSWQGAQTNLKQAYIIALGVNDIARMASYYPNGVGSCSNSVNMSDYTLNDYDTIIGNYAGIIQRLKSVQPRARFFIVTMPNEYNQSVVSYNSELRNICSIFTNCYLIDLANSGISFGNNSSFHSRYFFGNHMNVLGYHYIACLFIAYIDNIIRSNWNDFRDVPFIGTDKYLIDNNNS